MKSGGGGGTVTENITANENSETTLRSMGGSQAADLMETLYRETEQQERRRQENERMRQRAAEQEKKAREAREKAEKSGTARVTKAKFNKMDRAERLEAVSRLPIGTEITLTHQAFGGWGRVENVVTKVGDNRWKVTRGTTNNQTFFTYENKTWGMDDSGICSTVLTATGIKVPRGGK